ncbi:MAG: rod shape-determining protein MreC [Legionellaceae bacterium]|nr:rod shape-determining protein MreC [Legionellaceae bacterium]
MAISFRPNKKRNQLFKAAEKRYWHFPVALLLSLCLIFLDRNNTIAPIHRIVSSLAYPFQYVADTPSRLITWSRVFWGTKQALFDEARALYEEQLHLKVALQQLSAIQNENAVLKSLLTLADTSKHQTMAAEVLAFETTHTRHLFVINKGQKDGVLLGQLVLDTAGVTGQVIDVGLMTSTVLLISDAASAVPVRNQRTGETAILAGTNHPDSLSLIYLPKTASVLEGDVLVTSGLGKRYPAGYPVGVVHRVDNPSGEAFIRVDVRPFTQYHRNRLVLLVWPVEKNNALKKELKARLKTQGVRTS